MTGPLARTAAGDWIWQTEALDLEEAYDSPGKAVDAGVEAIRRAVEAGRLDRETAVELAMDARFALGAEEHHLAGPDSDAFETLSNLEDELQASR